MAGKSIPFADALLKLVLQGIGIPGIANNATNPLTLLYLSLHTADPGSNGTQNVAEAAYGGYARVAVARSALGFSVTGNVASPVGSVNFPTASYGNETELFMGIGIAPSGTGLLLWSGPLSPPIVVGNGVQPVITSTSTLTEN